jgi:hypothetical protein
MKTRVIWLAFGLAFFVTLAVVVGQRLSAEAMAVVVGVFAGVAASIPTSLIVVWLATRSAGSRPEPLMRPMPEARSAEPRIVVVAPPMAGTQAGYGYAPTMALAPYPPAPRRFTVIGGADVAYDEAPQAQEVVWPQ